MTPTTIQKITKKEKAVELYERVAHLPQYSIIKIFVNDLNLPSENSARTYVSLAKKSLAAKLNIRYKSRKIDYRKTKRGKAMEIFNKNRNLSRKEMIQLFIDNLNMTEASAATHCSQCSQEYTGPKHRAIVV